ncbi:hypothetical protein GL213_12715 [Halogeometricum borinquense]|uniref:Uncharacterized protein n=1 Tax=Halogeometricum borinquense TaxID=60847 RepID=A0A6C0UDR4_9EURY|nr:hypothetical protein [Halogeometricum borinquense]QIB73287.1 hypothetical protein G3I44_02710 [Halogeometricum borinquense]QIQ77315.1 hypothetical protein GL213_12715 [Halogeometricum borinquense]
MEKTPTGTPVGVDDPYDYAGVCDHLTGDGRCRFALDRAGDDPEFAAARRGDDYACVAADEDCEFYDCPHYRSTTDGRECVRCGLEEVRMAHETGARPLLEEHHLSYGESGGERAANTTERRSSSHRTQSDDDEPSHEITVALCRWCHTKVHKSFARIDDDASPDPEAFAAREERRSREQEEFGFSSAAERFGTDG